MNFEFELNEVKKVRKPIKTKKGGLFMTTITISITIHVSDLMIKFIFERTNMS